MEKILHLKLNIDSSTLLSKHFHHKLKFFQPSEAEKFLLLWKPDINYKIKLEKVDNKNSKTLWKPLYNILKEELLVLHKELTSLLNKSFIYIN